MSGRLMLITFNGRVTGRPYTTPVSYVQEEDSLLVPGGGTWWKNIETTPLKFTVTRVRSKNRFNIEVD